MSTPDPFSDDELFGFHFETEPSSIDDPFDDAEAWLAAQDVPDHVSPNDPNPECLDERWSWS